MIDVDGFCLFFNNRYDVELYIMIKFKIYKIK